MRDHGSRSCYLAADAKCGQCGGSIEGYWYTAKFCTACAKDRQKNPLASKAHRSVANAIRRGEIPAAKTLACVDCGSQAHDYDHRDYSKPLEVDPVCRPCNKLRGPAIGSKAA